MSAAIMAHPKRAGFVAELRRLTGKRPWCDDSRIGGVPAAGHFSATTLGDASPGGSGRRCITVTCRWSGAARAPADVGVSMLAESALPAAGRPVRGPPVPGASWLVMDQLWRRHRSLPRLRTWSPGATGRPSNYDTRMSRWLGEASRWYPWPSLVHRESPSLVPGRGHAGRVARRFIGADASALDIDYSGSVLRLPGINDYRPGGHPMLFVSERYPSLSIPTVEARFQDGFFEATRRGQVSYLQRPELRRRGVRAATDAEAAAWRDRHAAPATEPEPEGEPEGTSPGRDPGKTGERRGEDETPPKERRNVWAGSATTTEPNSPSPPARTGQTTRHPRRSSSRSPDSKRRWLWQRLAPTSGQADRRRREDLLLTDEQIRHSRRARRIKRPPPRP